MIEKLLQFLDVDDHQYQQAEILWEVLAPNVEAVLDSFYQKIRRVGIEPVLTDDVIAQLKARQKVHWERLFRSRFNQEYVASVARVGLRHRAVGLDLTSYTAGYLRLKMEFTNIVVHADLPVTTKGLLVKTLDRFIAVDMALALSTYDATLVD